MTKKILSSNLRKYKTKNPVKKILLDRFMQKVIAEITKLKPKKILDVGCGEAMVLSKMSSRFKPKSVYGIDTSKSAIENAKNNYPGGVFTIGDAMKLKFINNFFDMCLMFEVLEHLDNPLAAIKEVKRVSKKYCLFSVPHEPFFTILSLASGMHLNRLGKHPEHVNFWSRRTFLQLLKNEFRIVQDKSSFPWLFIVCKK